MFSVYLQFIPQTLAFYNNYTEDLRSPSGIENAESQLLVGDLTYVTDNDCLGNRAEALELGRQCSRRCRKDVPCENTRKQCLCDGLCGLSCLKPDLSCPELPKIENGDYSPSKNSLFNTKVTYHCNPGFYLFGSRERLCQGDEEWSGTLVECLAEPQCRNPIQVNHARNPNDGTYRLHEKVNYSCYPGYQSRGNPEATCKLIEKNQTAWVWSGNSFRCIPKSCGDPGQIENGKRHGESFIIASSVLYTCDEGFEMIGQARRYCQSDNHWSGQPPQCEPVTCNPTEHLENGKINYVYPLIYNSTVEYACDFGFRLVGPKRRRCGPEGKLVGEVPTCTEIDCGELGPLANGYIKGYSTRMGDKKEFSCRDGMKFIGEHNTTTCLESGSWSNSLPKCMAPCIIPEVEHALSIHVIPADLLSLAKHTNFTNMTLKSVLPGHKVEHGVFLEVICEKNYEFNEELDDNNIIQAPMCNNQTWSYVPQCRPASCRSSPPRLKNGRVRYASTEHDSVGHLHCLDGYRLTGANKTTRCVKGMWTNVNASCVEIYCGFPGVIPHGRVLLVGLTGMYDYKPYIRRISNNRQIAYECDSGFRLSDGAPNGATCLEGIWKPEGLPTCVKE